VGIKEAAAQAQITGCTCVLEFGAHGIIAGTSISILGRAIKLLLGLENIADSLGDGETPHQKDIVKAMKLTCGEMAEGEFEAKGACAKLDKNADETITEVEFHEWMRAQIWSDQLVKDARMRDVVWEVFSDGEDSMDMERCKKVVKEFVPTLTLLLSGRH